MLYLKIVVVCGSGTIAFVYLWDASARSLCRRRNDRKYVEAHASGWHTVQHGVCACCRTMGRFYCHILPAGAAKFFPLSEPLHHLPCCPRELCEGRSIGAAGVHHVRWHDAPNRVHQSHTQQELEEALGSKHTVTAIAVPIRDALKSMSSDGVYR